MDVSLFAPSGLIFKLNPNRSPRCPPPPSRKTASSGTPPAKAALRSRFRIDSDAILAFGKLAFWHADLYRWRGLAKEQEYWLRMSLALCPQLQDAVNSLAHLLMDQKRFDEAVAMVQQAESDDPRNEAYGPMLDWLNEARTYGKRERELCAELAKSPYDVQINLDLARLLQDEGKFPELNDRLRTAAGLTNWSHDAMAGIIQYYVDKAHNPDAAIAFLEARARIDPKESELIYSLAALDSSVGRKDDAIKYLTQAVAIAARMP